MQSQQNQMSSPMAGQGGPNGGQVMSPGGQPMQQMPMGQFQIIQPQLTGNAQYAMPQYATYNGQGQFVLHPGNFAIQGMPQTAGGQQIIFAAAPQQIQQQQKPGQQMITTAQQAQQQGTKTMVPMTMGQATSYTITSTGMATGGGQQTFMIANPMGGAPLMATQASMATAQIGGQIKQEANKQGQQQQQAQQAQQQATVQTQQQAILMPQGMAYMSPQAQAPQAIFQNGQLIFRAPMQDGSQPQIMFSPPAHPLPQQPTMQTATTHQQLPPGMTTNMQPISMQQATTQMRPPVSLPSQPPPGKTPISRSLPPLLPTVSTSQSMSRQNTYPGMPTLSANTTSSSPKASKQKMSPRSSSNSGHVGRPPGPTKSAVNTLKMPPPASMSPPILSSSPQLPAQPGSPMMLGPPVLQTSMPLTQLSRGSPHSQPPLLQPMMLPTVPTSSAGQDSTRYMGKPMDSQPPVLSANVPMPTLDNSKKFEASKSSMAASNSRKLDDHNDNSYGDSHSGNGQGSQTPKAVVKPNVLTHVIDGHIIQESSQPFPLDNSDSKGEQDHFLF